jgi:hypothetical protein
MSIVIILLALCVRERYYRSDTFHIKYKLLYTVYQSMCHFLFYFNVDQNKKADRTTIFLVFHEYENVSNTVIKSSVL